MSERVCPACRAPLAFGDCTNPECPNEFGADSPQMAAWPNRAQIKAATTAVLEVEECNTVSSFPADIRRQIVIRDEGRCVACGVTVALVDVDVFTPVAQFSTHHRVLKGMGGRSTDHRTVNGLTLCGDGVRGCHGKAHAQRQWATERGYIVEQGDSPETVPVVVRVPDYEDAPLDECHDEVYGLDGNVRFRVHPAPHKPCDDPACTDHGIAASNARESAYWDSIGGHLAPSVWPES